MAETKTYTPQEVIAKLAVTVKETLTKFEGQVQELKMRELQPKEGRLAKHELCPLCGGPDRNGVCECLTLKKNAQMGYGSGGQSPPTPGLGQMGGGGAMAQAEKPMKKDYGAGLADTSALSKHVPSSSAAALAPKAPAPATPIHQVNAELGGAKSIARSPVTPGGSLVMPKKFSIHAAGRVGNPERSVSGMIPNAKAEKEIAQTPAAVDKSMPGTKMPKAGTKISAPGSGGQILKKDEVASKPKAKGASKPKAMAGKGVGGKQPVGQGGGDAKKIAPAPAPAAKSRFAPTTGAPPKINTLKAAGNAEVGRMRGVAPTQPGKLPPPGGNSGLHGAVKPAPGQESYDVDVSDLAQPQHAPAGRGPAAAMSARLKSPAAQARATVAAPQAARHDATNLAADKKAGGVGFLNALIAKFRGPQPDMAGALAPQRSQQGQTSSKRFHGALPLRRSEKPVAPKIHVRDTGDKMDTLFGPEPKVLHPSDKKPKPMSKGEMALSKMGKCAMCSKAEHNGMCKGMNSSNHNRTMLSIDPRGKKSR